jgi:hypothetical protein
MNDDSRGRTNLRSLPIKGRQAPPFIVQPSYFILARTGGTTTTYAWDQDDKMTGLTTSGLFPRRGIPLPECGKAHAGVADAPLRGGGYPFL